LQASPSPASLLKPFQATPCPPCTPCEFFPLFDQSPWIVGCYKMAPRLIHNRPGPGGCENARDGDQRILQPTPCRRDMRVPLKPATLVTLTFHNTGPNLSHKQKPIKHEHNNSHHRWMRLRRDSLRIHSHTGSDASLSLSRLPASQWRAVFVFRHRACGSFQALARLAPLSCVAQRKGRHDPPGLLP
jgi:hypothetical protein